MKSRVLIAVLSIWAGVGLSTPMSVQVRSSKVRATPSQLGKAIATVQHRDIVEAGASQRGWYPVTTKDGKKGYVHASALSTKPITMRAGTLIVAIGVSLDEVALATKENRGSIGQLVAELERRDELDFTWVERMATFGVSDDQITTFRSEVGDQSVQEAGLMSTDQTDSVGRSEPAMEKTQQSLTVEQEHYLGRAVAARIFQTYAPLNQPQANEYLNLLGQSMAVFSDRPETFAGYRFLLLDSDEVNAFGAPGGLILVTRGMIRCCENEDELAAVLAHEICHIQNQDGLAAIQPGHMTEALTMLNSESGPEFGDVRSGSLPPEFEILVSDVVKTLTISGYPPNQEQQADADTMKLLRRSGYAEMSMITLLHRMGERLNTAGALGFAKTHPAAASRAKAARTLVEEVDSLPDSARQKRFAAAMGSVVTGD